MPDSLCLSCYAVQKFNGQFDTEDNTGRALTIGYAVYDGEVETTWARNKQGTLIDFAVFTMRERNAFLELAREDAGV